MSANLKTKTYEYDKLGPYSHPIIGEIINKQWFASKRAEGAQNPQWFNPMPLEVIALVATAVSHTFIYLFVVIKF